MRGQYTGEHSRLLLINRRALFVPCGCHSLNLLVSDAASSSNLSKMFFGFQRVCNIFSYSVSRWAILQSCVDITLKRLSDTRWECKIESIKAVRFQTQKVRPALIKLRETTEHSLTYCEANSLTEETSCYKFLITIIVWYDILFHINLVSNMTQNKTLSIDCASKLVDSTRKFILSYRENGFRDALCKANELVEEICVCAI
jgi:hypothetical protein